MRQIIFSALVFVCLQTSSADDLAGTVIEGWGRIVDPDDDCAVQLNDDSLSIRFGSGPHGLDAETNRMNSPRVLREINGDFTIQVTVDGELPLPEQVDAASVAYISGALVLMKDDENYIRLERASFTRGGNIWHYANFERRVDAKRTRMGLFADFPLQADKAVEMRLEVTGDQVRGLIRHVGDDWHELGTTRIADHQALLVGVSGVKTAAGESEVKFRGLQVQQNDPPVDAPTTSGIRLDPPLKFVPEQPMPKSEMAKLFPRFKELQEQASKISEMTDDEQLKLIADAKQFALVKTEQFSARFGSSIAKSIAHSFISAERPKMAVRVYREFADALESLNDNTVKTAIEGLRTIANQLETELNPIGEPAEHSDAVEAHSDKG